MPLNPLLVSAPDPAVQFPIAELKQHLLFFCTDPPGPRTARAVYDLYLSNWGDVFRVYAPTLAGSLPSAWTPAARRHFEDRELPDLRRHDHWGFTFSDDRSTDSWIFSFHGYRPASEPGKASFFRFEFDWLLPADRIAAFAEAVLKIVTSVSGYGGYIFQGLPNGPYGKLSFDQIYAFARRYWGVEAQDLDVTVDYMLDAYKAPTWLTVIGPTLEAKSPASVAAAAAAAHRATRTPGGVILQAGPAPTLGDRHRFERLDVYQAMARVLEPLQVVDHSSFGGTRWTDETTNAWLRRFSDPARFAAMA